MTVSVPASTGAGEAAGAVFSIGTAATGEAAEPYPPIAQMFTQQDGPII